jgi:hypothetical protein
MTLLFSQDKMIDWLTKQISKHESYNNDKEVKESKQKEEGELVEKIYMITLERMEEEFTILMIISHVDYTIF